MSISREEYRALRDWVRHRSEPGMERRKAERKLDAYEREHGVPDAVPTPASRVGTRWFVTLSPTKPGKRGGHRKHLDRECPAINDIPDRDIREATESEIEQLAPCWYCAGDGAR